MELDLIPRSEVNECPRNTQYKDGIRTCSCEDHCGWDLCRLVKAPDDCIVGTHSEWQWDHVQTAWVAQVIPGNSASIKREIYNVLF